MSFVKEKHGSFTFSCDGCADALATDDEDFRDAVETLKCNVWALIPVWGSNNKKEWYHFCRDCRNEGERLARSGRLGRASTSKPRIVKNLEWEWDRIPSDNGSCINYEKAQGVSDVYAIHYEREQYVLHYGKLKREFKNEETAKAAAQVHYNMELNK